MDIEKRHYNANPEFTVAARKRKAMSLQILDEMEKGGLTAEYMVKKLKQGLRLCQNDKVMIPSMVRLIGIWNEWVKMGNENGRSTNTFNLFSELDSTQRSRVDGIVEKLRAEAGRRGLPPVLPGDPEVEDPEALQRVVEPGEDEAPIVDTSSP